MKVPKMILNPTEIVEKIVTKGKIIRTPRSKGILNIKATNNNIPIIIIRDNVSEPVKLVILAVIQLPTSPLELNTELTFNIVQPQSILPNIQPTIINRLNNERPAPITEASSPGNIIIAIV